MQTFRWLAVTLLLQIASSQVWAQTCADTGADHDREALKNRPAPPSLPANLAPVGVADVIAWSVPHVRPPWSDTDPVVGEELQVVRLHAFVRRFGCEADGDHHLEVADSGTAKRRVIVEVPESQDAVRHQLEQFLGGPPTKKGRTFNGAKAIPLEFWGWRFLDLSHQSALIDSKTHQRRTIAQLKRGHGHGTAAVQTIWEPGHAVFHVERWMP